MLLVSQFSLMEGFQDIENNSAVNSAARVLNLIQEDLDSNISTAVPYSEWDDTYNYVKKPNEEYIKLNYDSDAIFNSRFNVVAVSDLQNKILFCRSYDLKERSPESGRTQYPADSGCVKSVVECRGCCGKFRPEVDRYQN
jgi:sensor domain CHASE-containing protein